MHFLRRHLLVTLLLASAAALRAGPVAVRYPEGSGQGFLILRGLKGEELAVGEVQQKASDQGIHSHLVFRFKDGSLYDETVVFSQRKTFVLRQYRLVQRGPSFPTALDVSLDRETGRYKVKAREEGKPEESFDGQLDLPPDVSNGMLSLLLRNLPKGTARTVQVVVFSPKPQLLELELIPDGEARFFIGKEPRKATHYRIRPKPKVGIKGAVASLMGKDATEYHFWILTDGPPAFLAFQGPLFAEGPIWRVEWASPRWPKGQGTSS